MRPTRSAPRQAARACRRHPWRVATAAVLLAALVTACTAADDGLTTTQDATAPAMDVDEGEAPTAGIGREVDVADDQAGPRPPEFPGPDEAITGEHVVRTAEITLEMEDTERALDDIRRVAERVGGIVATADLRRDRPAGDLGGVIVVRVPSPELLTALDGLEELAVDAPVRRIDERDVTSEVVDLRARITNLAAYEAELRELLTEVREGTSDADRLLPVFERVQEVRSEIDRLTAQRDSLADRVARSTITVTVRPAPGAEPVPATTWAPLRTLERALATTVAALTTVADAAIWVAVTALPVTLVVAGPPAFAWWAWRRRHPRTVTPAPTAAGGGAGSSPPPAGPDGG